MLEKIAKLFEEEFAKLEKESYEKGYKDGLKAMENGKEEVCAGDKIRITDDTDSLGFYLKGDILTVARVEDSIGVYVKELEGIPGGNFFIRPREFEVLKDNPFASPKCSRKAVVGDLIQITEASFVTGNYENGAILEVVDVLDNVVNVRGLYLEAPYDDVPVNICHNEYVVVGKVYS